ncbi:MAG TPA: HEPN domain-containing protein [Candidatus Nanoarchaeia archaeon]|nr:HEPN domain-containing protein [Candidatus Nanoarchaeia archaeon]
MSRINDRVEWCLEQGKKGEKHKGLRNIAPNVKEAERQLQKAVSDLETMQYLYEGKRTDWVASAAFYAMYHSLLAVLYKLGYESRNQECTITFIEKLIEDKAISLEQFHIDHIRSLQEGVQSAKSIREEMQYGTKTSLEDARCQRLMEQAKEFVDRIREALEEVK